MLNDPKYDPINGALPSTVSKDIEDEEKNIQEIPGASSKDRLYYTKASMKSFISALKSYKKTKEERVVEIAQFHRFDELFVQAKMYQVLNVYNVLAPADIKALTARESGDFIYVQVAGVGKNKPGYQNKLTPKYPKLYTGIGQIGAPAKTEGINWAKGHGIEIPLSVDGVDSRDLPEYAVLISASYLSHLYKELKAKYGSRLPSNNNERKKLIFAVYNWNLAGFNSMVQKNLKADEPITYSKVKSHLPGETQIYVTEIFTRLGH